MNKTNIHEFTDNVGYGDELLEAVIGDSATADTLLHTVDAQITRVQALADADYEGPLLEALKACISQEVPGLRYHVQRAFARAYVDTVLEQENETLAVFYGGLRAADDRICAEFVHALRSTGMDFPAEFTQPPVDTELADVDAPGAITDQTLVAAPIDTDRYAAGTLQMVVTELIVMTTGTEIEVTVTGLTFFGDTYTATGLIPDDAAVDSVHVLTPEGSGSAKFCKRVTGIVCTPDTGTWDTGAFEVRTKHDRALAA